MDVQKIYQIFLYNTMSHKTIGGVYMVMNGIYLVIASACILILAYRFYGAFIAAKVLTLDEYRPTPAMVHNDGHDYVPTNKWVTFGHHFAAIAGAGPLVGPVIAAQFGYLPGALWILIGSVLAGAVHDMVILFASVRYDGKSIADIAREEISKFAGFGAMLATLFLLIITLAGMAVVVANALHNSPWGFFSVFATIPIAIFIGIYLPIQYKFGYEKTKFAFGVIIMASPFILPLFMRAGSLNLNFLSMFSPYLVYGGIVLIGFAILAISASLSIKIYDKADLA